MKKISEVLLLIFLSISLISCEPNNYYFKNNTRNDEIVSVELISYSPDNVAVTESTDEMLDFYTSNMTTLEVLDSAKNEDFISEFGNIEFFLEYPHLNTSDGIGIKINYENGDFLIVTNTVFNEKRYGDAILYNSDGLYQDFYGGISWEQNFIDLVNKYFQTQID